MPRIYRIEKKDPYFSKMFKNRESKMEKIPGKTIGALSPQYRNIADGLQPFYKKEFPGINFFSGKGYADKAFSSLDYFEYITKDQVTGMEEWRSCIWGIRVLFYPEMICEVRAI